MRVLYESPGGRGTRKKKLGILYSSPQGGANVHSWCCQMLYEEENTEVGLFTGWFWRQVSDQKGLLRFGTLFYVLKSLLWFSKVSRTYKGWDKLA